VWDRDKYFHELLKTQVFNAILNTLEQKVLELGVGTGIYLEQFILKGHYVTGVDISIEMLRISKNKLKAKGYNSFDLILADAEYLPFRKGVFDIINCIEMLRHLPEPYKTIWKVFGENRNVLKKLGSLLITIPNILFPLNLFSVFYYIIPRYLMRLFHRKIGFHQNQQYISFPHFPVLYNEPEDHMFNLLFLKRLINNSNLKIAKLKGIFFFPACPKIFFSMLQKLDMILGSSFWVFLAYSFFIKLNHSV
jgi:ubiquinone/menaquinone biosynthesis C-methylase UbiE